MRQVYLNKWCETPNTAPSKYVYSDVVKPGYVLHVHTCFAHDPERAANEIITMGILDAGRQIILRSRGCAIAKEGMSALKDFFVGEGDKIFAYFPDATGDDPIELHVVGVLLSLDEWREKGE